MNGKRTRVVLVHPPLKNVITAATPDYVDENRGHTPPMGLLYLQSAIEHSRHESVFLDADLEGWSHEEAARRALSYGPDIIGLQAMSFTMPDAYLVAKAAKAIDPEVATVIGGPHPTIYPRETAGLEAVDFAFAGEGEKNFIAFLDMFRDPVERTKVPGVACRAGEGEGEGGATTFNPAGLLRDIDEVHYPARRSSHYERYSSVLAAHNPVTVMITSRGCPFSCIFCNRMGRQYRCHSAGYVLGEIEEIIGLGIKEVFIHDDTFTLNRKRVVDICEGIISRGYRVSWEARTRADCVDEELLSLMKRAGCTRLSFGVESGSEKVLKKMNKDMDLKRVEDVFRWCRKEGITTLADFIFGNMDEEADDMEKTLDLVKRINPDYVQYSILSPYPDTPLYKLGVEKGILPGDVWAEFATDPLKKFSGPLWTQNFTEEELVSITARAYRAFYTRPSFIFRQLRKISSLEQFKNMARAATTILFS